MRVLIFMWHETVGDHHGAGPTDVAMLLGERGHDVTIVCASLALQNYNEPPGISVLRTDYLDFGEFIDAGPSGENFDVIHAFAGPSLDWAVKFSERFKLPLFLTVDREFNRSGSDCSKRYAGLFASSIRDQHLLQSAIPDAADRVYYLPRMATQSFPAPAPSSSSQVGLKALVYADKPIEKNIDFTVLKEIWRLQVSNGWQSLEWNIACDPSDYSDIRDYAEYVNRELGILAICLHDANDRDTCRSLEGTADVVLASAEHAATCLAASRQFIAIDAAGSLGHITRENFWHAVHVGFRANPERRTASASDVFSSLRSLQADRTETDCSDLARSYFSTAIWASHLVNAYSKALKRLPSDVPAPFMPDAEAQHLMQAYSEASVILEYGSGGSTEYAARMPQKYVMSVESDAEWARALRKRLIHKDIVSQAVIHHVDIGPTGPWGRPIDDRKWRLFHTYFNGIWEKPWFRQPDLVLIDGRFRTACLAIVLLRTERPVRVLFDDYGVRPSYHRIEKVIKPVKMVGRMAEFHVVPGSVKKSDIGVLIRELFQITMQGISEKDYQLSNLGD